MKPSPTYGHGLRHTPEPLHVARLWIRMESNDTRNMTNRIDALGTRVALVFSAASADSFLSTPSTGQLWVEPTGTALLFLDWPGLPFRQTDSFPMASSHLSLGATLLTVSQYHLVFTQVVPVATGQDPEECVPANLLDRLGISLQFKRTKMSLELLPVFSNSAQATLQDIVP